MQNSSWKDSKALSTLRKWAPHWCNYIDVDSAPVHFGTVEALQQIYRLTGGHVEYVTLKISLISKTGISTHLISLVLVRQYSRAIGGSEEFLAQFLGNSYFCSWLFFVCLFFQPRGKARRKKDLREFMVASVSDSNHLMSLEAEQSVTVLLLFILPLQSCKIKWDYSSGRLFFPPFLSLSTHPILLHSCWGDVTLYSIHGVFDNPKQQ